MTLINLFDFKPPARSAPDNNPWQKYELQSSINGVDWDRFEGPTDLVPPIVDPSNPPSYNFTSVDAPIEAVYFRVLWRDSNGIEAITAPLTRPITLPAWTPSLGDVASHILLRTKSTNGKITGKFSDDTPPATAEMVSLLIPKGVSRVRHFFADPITDPADAEKAKDLAAIYVAMLVELNLFSQQIENDQSPYLQLKELWDDATGGGTEGGEGGDSDDLIGKPDPSWKFERRRKIRF